MDGKKEIEITKETLREQEAKWREKRGYLVVGLDETTAEASPKLVAEAGGDLGEAWRPIVLLIPTEVIAPLPARHRRTRPSLRRVQLGDAVSLPNLPSALSVRLWRHSPRDLCYDAVRVKNLLYVYYRY